jgi:hypothetical protein
MRRIIRFALIVVACTVLGLLAGLVLQSPILKVISEGTFTRWRSIGSPSEEISSLLGVGQYGPGHVVYVETEAGDVYRCCPQAPGQWEKTDLTRYMYDQACVDLPRRAAPPPQPALACVEIAAYEWVTDRTQYALLEDGTVWIWHHHVGLDTLLEIIGGSSLVGGLAGVLLAWRRQGSRDRERRCAYKPNVFRSSGFPPDDCIRDRYPPHAGQGG